MLNNKKKLFSSRLCEEFSTSTNELLVREGRGQATKRERERELASLNFAIENM